MKKQDKDYCMYIFINKGLGMSQGKMVAQGGHAVFSALNLSNSNDINEWVNQVPSQKKIVLSVKNTAKMIITTKLLKEYNLNFVEIYDAGKTEVKPNSFTAIGVEICDKIKYKDFFSKFSLLK